MPGSAAKKRGAVSAEHASPPCLVALHRCSTIDWTPSPIVAIQACPDGSVVAVAREDGDIEFWDTEFWHCASVIPGKEEAAITALTWIYDQVSEKWRLFSCGLDTNVVEWDLRHLQPRCITSSMGGAVWDAAAQPSTSAADDGVLVAIATDDGAVRLLVAEHSGEGLQYKKSFGRAECRALSVAWSPDGTIVYAGYSDGCIRAHAVSSGHEVLRITAAPLRAAGTEECIWSLAVLMDGSLLSGSSRGVTQLWEPQFGTLLSSFHQHQSDVLCVAAAPDASRVFSAGVDPSLAMFERPRVSDEQDGGRLQLSERKRPHTHDVRAIAVVTTASGASFLITGGNDAQLLVHSVERFERLHPVRVCRCPQAPSLGVSWGPRPPLLLSRSRTLLDVWRFPSCSASAAEVLPMREEGATVPVQDGPAHILRARVPGVTSCCASALAPNGAWIAAATPHRTYLVALDSGSADSAAEQPAAPDVGLVPLPVGTPAALALCFSADSGRLFVGDADGGVTAVDLGPECEDDQRVQQLHRFEAGAAESFGSLQSAGGALHGRLPLVSADGPVTAACFSNDGTTVAIATTECKLSVYDCAKLAAAAWLRQRADVAAKLDAMPGFVQGLSFRPTPSGADDLLLLSHSALCHVSLAALRQGGRGNVGEEERKKRQRGKGKPVLTGDPQGAAVRLMPQRGLCLGAAFVDVDTVLLVESDWNDVLKRLPLPMALRLYGQ